MIVRTKPLKTKLKQTQNPFEDFKRITESIQSSTSKEVLFIRYIGIPGSLKQFTEQLMQLEDHFSSLSNTCYLRLQGLERLSNIDDITRVSREWEEWNQIRNASYLDQNTLDRASLSARLEDETLEWTKKLTFLEVLSLYKASYPNANETTMKNFALKMIHWMSIYLPKLFKYSAGTKTSPKVLFIGDIKHHEMLFLYFLSKLGCDVCYMNPKEDILHIIPDADSFSTLYNCGTLYSDPVSIPDNKPASNHAQPAPVKIVPSIGKPISSGKTSTERPMHELGYEQLASLASSVVMIKTLDQDNKAICFGSGVVIHQKGYILTNLHVIEGGHHFSVVYENETDEYVTDTIIKYHAVHDLAVIKVDRLSSPLPVKTAGNLVRGQKIVAIGSPLGLFNSVSDGIVSGFRDIRTMSMIQFTAPISDGSSGGALMDMNGRLVGLITAGFNEGQNLNLAVPFQTIYEFAHNFIERRD